MLGVRAEQRSLTPSNWCCILLDISNSVLPRDKLAETPSSKDGLPTESELQIRSLACDLLQIAGKLLKIPQVRYTCPQVMVMVKGEGVFF